MAGAKEIMGTSIMERSSSTKLLIQRFNHQRRKAEFVKFNKGKRLLNGVKPIIAAVSEDYYLINTSPPSDLSLNLNDNQSGDPKLKIRAVVTVRKKIKEDFKEAFVKHFDNFAEKFGRNVVLQLVSTEVDPSMFLFIFSFILISFYYFAF